MIILYLKEDFGMLNKEAQRNLQLIKQMIIQIWGEDCELLNIDIKDSPYSEFELLIRLYHKVEAGRYYDRSALDIGIKQNEKYILLGNLTNKPVVRGIKAMDPKNLRSNFLILNEVAQAIVENYK